MRIPQCRESETFLLARAFTQALQQTKWPWHCVHIYTGPPAKSYGLNCSLASFHQGGSGPMVGAEQENHFQILQYQSTMAQTDLEMGGRLEACLSWKRGDHSQPTLPYSLSQQLPFLPFPRTADDNPSHGPRPCPSQDSLTSKPFSFCTITEPVTGLEQSSTSNVCCYPQQDSLSNIFMPTHKQFQSHLLPVTLESCSLLPRPLYPSHSLVE